MNIVGRIRHIFGEFLLFLGILRDFRISSKTFWGLFFYKNLEFLGDFFSLDCNPVRTGVGASSLKSRKNVYVYWTDSWNTIPKSRERICLSIFFCYLRVLLQNLFTHPWICCSSSHRCGSVRAFACPVASLLRRRLRKIRFLFLVIFRASDFFPSRALGLGDDTRPLLTQ
jgi:hypothetical protein